MAIEERLSALRSKHESLDLELKMETRRPLPDPALVAKLKREKLRLKDEMMRITH